MASSINSPYLAASEPHKKRVLFVITQSEMGGAQRFLYNFLSRIKNKYDILVATGSDGKEELAQRLNLQEIKTIRIGTLKRDIDPVNDIKACLEIKNLINSFRPDTLFLLSTKAGFIGSLAAQYSSESKYLKVIYRIGGWTFNDPWPNWKKNLWIILERLSARWKDIIILNNRHDLEQAKKLGIKPKDKLALVHNGIDPYKIELLPKDEAKLRLFSRISDDPAKISLGDTIIGTVANFYPPKGLKILIDTAEYFKNSPSVKFLIIGDGQERKEIEELIRQKGLKDKVFLAGQIKEASQFMQAFDVFVLPSVKEGFPFVILEAMAAKLPVIATKVGAVPEIIDNGRNGFIVEPGNSAALAGKLKELLASDHLYKEFSIQGHQTVIFNFTEDKMVRETENLL